MKYFFVLGNNNALSLAELSAVLHFRDFKLLTKNFLIIDSQEEIVADKLVKRLGGIIKIGKIVSELDNLSSSALEKEITRLAELKQATTDGGKFNFGFSNYGQFVFNTKNIGLKLKKHFNSKKISSRLVISKDKNLSSVVVTQNKLLKRGMEFVLTNDNAQVLVGETIAVQDFKGLSRRDYGRPVRDDLSGMLPPKLAQIMINLAQLTSKDSVIVDPFCGSGTILSEALLMEYNNLFASDISSKAVSDTRKNVEWLKELVKIEGFHLKLKVKNAIDLSKFIKKESVDAIITEPYLGPQRGKIMFSTVINNLEELYSQALVEFLKVLKVGGRVVMVWPLFYGQRPISPNYSGFKILNMLPLGLRESKLIKKNNNRPTIIYGRTGQKVYREIVVLEKI